MLEAGFLDTLEDEKDDLAFQLVVLERNFLKHEFDVLKINYSFSSPTSALNNTSPSSSASKSTLSSASEGTPSRDIIIHHHSSLLK